MMDGMGLLKIPNSKGEALGRVLEEICSRAKASRPTLYSVFFKKYFVLCITTNTLVRTP